MMARSTTLQHKARYIDARPPTASSSKSSCYARPDHTLGSFSTDQRCLRDVRFPPNRYRIAALPQVTFRANKRHALTMSGVIGLKGGNRFLNSTRQACRHAGGFRRRQDPALHFADANAARFGDTLHSRRNIYAIAILLPFAWLDFPWAEGVLLQTRLLALGEFDLHFGCQDQRDFVLDGENVVDGGNA